jgi:hypothetical protein
VFSFEERVIKAVLKRAHVRILLSNHKIVGLIVRFLYGGKAIYSEVLSALNYSDNNNINNNNNNTLPLLHKNLSVSRNSTGLTDQALSIPVLPNVLIIRHVLTF